jgi:poly(A) polymerase
MNVEPTDSIKRRLPPLKERLQRAGLFKLFDQLPGGEFYLVGGVVRDLMLGRETEDLDMVVRCVPLPLLEGALQGLGRVQFVGKNFGVFKLIPDPPWEPGTIDIALPRTERSQTLRGAYREFEIFSDPDLPLEEDLKRRDFTVNAMALDLRSDRVVDPFDGRGDLKRKRLRAVGDPRQRFQEDYSRILRGIRFACQLDFELDEETWSALRELVSGLNAQRPDGSLIVPREVLGRELVRAFTSEPVRALDLLEESGAIQVILPELLPMKGCPQPRNFHSEGDVWTHTRLALTQLASSAFQQEFPGEKPDAETVLAVLFHDLGKPHTLKTPERDGTDRIRFDGHDRVGARLALQICDRLKLSQYPKGHPLHVDGERVAWLVGKHLILVQGQVREMKATTIERYFLSPTVPGRTLLKLILADSLATIHESGSPDLTSYYQIRERIREIQSRADQSRQVPDPLLNGDEVMQVYRLEPGPRVGEILAYLREEQLTGRIKSREEALALLERSRESFLEGGEEDRGSGKIK